jgi:hypothetical protein
MRPSATITVSVYFHATGDELAAVGTDYVLNEATGTRGEQSTSGQQARLLEPRRRAPRHHRAALLVPLTQVALMVPFMKLWMLQWYA